MGSYPTWALFGTRPKGVRTRRRADLQAGLTLAKTIFRFREGFGGGFEGRGRRCMTVLGLGSHERSGSEVRVGFRSGWVRSVGITIGSAGIVSLVIGLMNLAREQPAQMFDLLSRWGFVWLISLAAMFLVWDLAKTYLGRLSESIQEMAVAMNRVAEKDDRERDRVANEIGFVGRRVERMASDLTDHRDEQRRHNREIKELLRQRAAAGQGGAGDGSA